MVKTNVLFIYFVLISFQSFCQQIDYNKIIIPENIAVDNFAEKLVQLAWKNNPSSKVAISNKEIAQITLTQSRWAWLNQITVAGNLNEFTVNPDPDNNILFPRYNFGLSIPLGIFISNPTESKVALKELEKADLEIKQQMLVTRNQVLKAYQNYLMHKEIYQLKSELKEDEYANFLSIEKKFEDGEVSLEEYKFASRNYISELEAQISAKNQLENAILEIEFLIGINLEELI